MGTDRARLVACLAGAALLAGCGLKGDLYLPEGGEPPAAETPVTEEERRLPGRGE